MISIGIDIGGTSIKGAAVDSTGKIYETYCMPIVKGDSQDKIIEDLINATKEYISSHDLDGKINGIGIGIPGTIDSTNGIVTYSANLKWKELHVVEKFEKGINLPVRITNDANAAALGEAVFGAGKKYQNMVMITLGTGVGGGVVIDGKLFEGNLGKGAELGHTTLVYNGLPCGCGRRGCFEQYASATALIRITEEKMEQNKDSLMWEVKEKEGKVNGKVAFTAAKMGDKAANEVVDQYVEYLSEGLLNICNVFRPNCIVLSGGIANQREYLVDKVVKYCEKYEYGYPFAPKTEIKIAELGYESGIIGAACLMLNK